MSKLSTNKIPTVEFYDSITSFLSLTLKMKAQIESLRFEKALYDLCIEQYNIKIKDQEKVIADNQNEQIVESAKLYVKEFEVKIMEQQSKKSLCDIRITRMEYDLKNYKEF